MQLPEKLKLPKIELEEGKGSLSIYIDEISSSRTILPKNTDWSSFTGDFRIDITGLAPVLRNINNLSAPIQLDAGNYTVTVTALDGGTNPIARGEINITVIAGEPEAHIIRLRAIMDAGTGTFGWNVTIPADASGQMRITQIDGTFVSTENLMQGTNNGSRVLDSDYYFVTTTLTKAGRVDIIRRDVLHIYQNMTSVFEIEFTDTLFNNSLHYVTFDFNYGGLSEMQPVIHGELIAPLSPDPQRNGYGFAGWFTEAAAVNAFNFSEPVLNDITLYAGWIPNTASITLTVAQIENGDPIFTSFTTPIKVSRNGFGGAPAVFIVNVPSAGNYSYFKWEIAGVGLMPAVVSEGAAVSSFTINAANPNYGILGGHVLKLTVTRNGILYQVNIPFTIIETIPPVEVTVNGVITEHADLAAAFNAIGTQAGSFIITLRENQTMTANRTIGAENQHITIVGEGARTITHGIANTSVAMFTINNAASSLTLGNNVTIQGRSTAGTSDVIFIQNGTFRMLEGSMITGHQLNTENSNSSVVYMSGTNPIFEMSGGIINGNNNIPGVTNTNTGSGVYMSSGTFTMTGGSITGNSPVDIFVNSTAIFNLSGNAVVGNIRLNTASAAANATINLGTFNGTVGTLNLRGDNSTMNTAISWWAGKQVIQAAAGYNLTTADMAKFPLGNFISSTVGAAQAISPNYYIGTESGNLGKLIALFSGPGSGTVADPFNIYNEADLLAVGRGNYNGAAWSLSAHYRLMNNITLTGGNWTPIGDLGSRFSGTFNGNGKTITEMTNAANSTTYQGMFGFLSTGSVVRNLGLVNVNIRGTGIVGGIAGETQGTIENCFVTGSITVTGSEVGGIAGHNDGGIIQNCYVIANITGTDDLGGIIGYVAYGSIIRNCYVAGTITSVGARDYWGVGGISGYNTQSLQNCIALLQSITLTSGNDYNRINGYGSTPLINNRAWSGTVLSPAKTAISNLTGNDGLSVTAAALKTQATWQNAATSGAAFSFGITDTSPWVWENGKMPRFHWETTARDWPSYLTD